MSGRDSDLRDNLRSIQKVTEVWLPFIQRIHTKERPFHSFWMLEPQGLNFKKEINLEPKKVKILFGYDIEDWTLIKKSDLAFLFELIERTIDYIHQIDIFDERIKFKELREKYE